MRLIRSQLPFVRVSLVLVAALGFIALVFVRHSYPDIDGVSRVAGLESEVDVYRGRHGIPIVQAEIDGDLYFAQGYVHAQDRLWQMEFQRRVAFGRTAEVFGEEFVSTDAFLRRMGLPEVSRRAVETAGEEALAMIDSYVSGINAYLDRGPRPLEMRLLGVEPRPWTREDVGAVLALMGFDLGLNWESEAVRAAILEEAGERALSQILPENRNAGPPVWSKDQAVNQVPFDRGNGVPALSGRSDVPEVSVDDIVSLRKDAGLEKLGRLPSTGSNSWVLASERTDTGFPQLANDPHLELGLPSLWYEIELVTRDADDSAATDGERRVRGFSIPGVPTVVVGYNDDVAWGLTNTGDTQDLYHERRHEEDPHLFERDGEWYEARVTEEEIPVSGREAAETIEIVRTKNGPVILDDPPLSVYWTAFDIERSPFDAFLRMNRAETAEQFREALAWFELPAQNVVYGDRHGDIGFKTVGRIPARQEVSGLVPRPGWDSSSAVPEPIPFDALPELRNPPQGYIATANHRVVDDSYPYLINTDVAPGARMQRIVNTIEGSNRMSMRASASLQTDWVNLHAARRLDEFLAAIDDNVPERGWNDVERELIGRLRRWQQRPEYTRSSTEALLFSHWYLRIMDQTLGGVLSDELYSEVLETGYVAYNATDAILSNPSSLWIEGSRDELFVRTFRETVDNLRDRFGDDISSWRWDHVQSIKLSHNLSEVPGLGLLLDRGPYPIGGSHMTVGRAAYDLRDPFNVDHGAGVRMVVSLEPRPRSLVAHAGGQSGHPGHRWYADQFQAWREGRTRRVSWRSRDLDAPENEGSERGLRGRQGKPTRLRLVPPNS
ncbi:MAG: penicillin acylase family protein [Spirochaetales bacterium]